MSDYKDRNALMQRVAEILEETRCGVLATVGKDGAPRMDWMTPAVLCGRPGVLFSISLPGSEKLKNIEDNPLVEWMIQDKTLTRIVYLRGRVNIIDNPAIRSEVMQVLGKNLKVLWKVSDDPWEYVVMETCIESAEEYFPMKGIRHRLEFGKGDCDDGN